MRWSRVPWASVTSWTSIGAPLTVAVKLSRSVV